MIDPVSALALATTAFNGVKKAVEMGKEVHDIYSQLSGWAGHISDIQEYINQAENKKPGLWDKIGFAKSETAEAFDLMIAKQKVKQMEDELREMFLYGNLQSLGMEGLREFYQMRREIKEKREKMVYEQMRRRKAFFHTTKQFILITIVLSIGFAILYQIFNTVYLLGSAAGKW
jgi:hypothetical protein